MSGFLQFGHSDGVLLFRTRFGKLLLRSDDVSESWTDKTKQDETWTNKVAQDETWTDV